MSAGKDEPPRKVSRRKALTILGGASLGVVAAACSRNSVSPGGSATPGGADGGSTPTSVAAGQADCVLTPETTEGPFYLDLDMVRRDITEGKAGTPLTLDLTVVDAASCRPIRDAAVDVWHTDAEGAYSGVGSAPRSSTFLRGIQMTDADGKAQFQTIYPGWYQGRAVHIHIKVSTGGNEAHTGQLFFPDDLSSEIYGEGPYAGRGEMDTTNQADGIFSRGGAQSTLKMTRNGDGYTGSLTMGIRPA
ncbi:MAG TPA: intradiol ring-cleavage dioxygenase [Actinomycetota bacterium]|nr:intradiol ring-cleavage dioxygenase [Actinomycetota bacterium]